MAKYFDDVNIKFEKESDTYLKLTAEPFDRGYATTIGNTLRRTLLTSIPGAAVTSLRVDGVPHEFSTIPGVVEDVTDIVLNLKKLRFRLLEGFEGPELINIAFQGPGKILGKHIEDKLSEFELLNGDVLLATVNNKKMVNFEVRISRGKGYAPAIKNKRKDDVLGTIPVDSIYNPITKVAWDVQPIPTSTEGHERLILEVSSDGSTAPKDAINHAANVTRQHLAFFMFNDSAVLKAINEEEVNEAMELKNLLSKSIDEMELSVRSHNCLQAAGIITIGELVSKDEGTMLKYKNFGRKSLTELQQKLGEMNLHFGMDIQQFVKMD